MNALERKKFSFTLESHHQQAIIRHIRGTLGIQQGDEEQIATAIPAVGKTIEDQKQHNNNGKILV